MGVLRHFQIIVLKKKKILMCKWVKAKAVYATYPRFVNKLIPIMSQSETRLSFEIVKKQKQKYYNFYGHCSEMT